MKLRTDPEAIRPVRDAEAPAQKTGIIDVDRAGNATVREGRSNEAGARPPDRDDA